MISSLAILAPLAATLVSANPVARWTESNADCRTFYKDVYAQASNIDLNSVLGGKPPSQEALVQAQIDQLAPGSTVMQEIMAAPALNASGTYSLWFEYCQPKNGQAKGVFQTHHGLVGNAGYWNAQLNGKTDNSFAESAAAAGWATLSYDRLGVGRSAHPDGIQVVQISYEIAQSVNIAGQLRDGSFGNGVPQFSNVVGVGHSYGSAMMAGVASVAPDAFDVLVLTGFTANLTASMGPLGLPGFDTTIASVAYPARFPYGSDYVSTPSVSVDQKEFFHYPNYTSDALQTFTTTKGEYTLGQTNSIGGPFSLTRDNFNKPTFIITGENDAPFCQANCLITSLGANATQLDTARPLFPSVADADFETFVVPATGHGINFHTTAYDAYQQIVGFVSKHV